MRYKYSFFLLLAFDLILLFGVGFYFRERLWQQFLSWKGKAPIVFYGDSITAQGNWNTLLDDYRIKNSGFPGLGVVHLKDWVDDQVVTYEPTVCWVMAGVNDLTIMKKDVASTYKSYEILLKKIEERGIQPVVQLTLYEVEDAISKMKIDSLNRLLTEYCQANQIKVVNPNQWLSDSTGLKMEYARDKTHLNQLGYTVWAEYLRNELD